MSASFTIRPLQRGDIQAVTDWARQEHYAPGRGDVDIYRHTDRQGIWVGWLGSQPIGCIAGVRYSDAYGFPGAVFGAPPVARPRLWVAVVASCHGASGRLASAWKPPPIGSLTTPAGAFSPLLPPFAGKRSTRAHSCQPPPRRAGACWPATPYPSAPCSAAGVVGRCVWLGLPGAGLIWEPACLEHRIGPWPARVTTAVAGDPGGPGEDRLWSCCQRLRARPVTWEELLRCHSASYLELVERELAAWPPRTQHR